MLELKSILAEEVIEEGTAVFPEAIIKKIAAMTDRNDHNGARILAAKTMKDKKLEAAYIGVAAIADVFGHLPNDLNTIRYEMDKRLWHKAKEKYSNGQAVYQAM